MDLEPFLISDPEHWQRQDVTKPNKDNIRVKEYFSQVRTEICPAFYIYASKVEPRYVLWSQITLTQLLKRQRETADALKG